MILDLSRLNCDHCVFQRSVGLPDVHSGYGFAIGKLKELTAYLVIVAVEEKT